MISGSSANPARGGGKSQKRVRHRTHQRVSKRKAKSMTTMFVRHLVADFAAWRRVYDEFDPTRQSMGVTAHAVFRSVAEPNDVTVTHEFATADAAQRFAASNELRNALQGAGVTGEPTIWFAERM